MKSVPKLDSYDLAILRELQANGRITKVALAEAVNLSPSPCWERLKRLETAGLITGYHAIVDIRKIVPVTELMVQVTLQGHTSADFQRFEAAMDARSEVQACWALGGGIDYILRLVVADIDAYQRLMDQLLDEDIGIEKYFGYVVTKTVKQNPDPIPDQ
jgi:Lrp/AsnC family transcriptional regulator of ectoine degradation